MPIGGFLRPSTDAGNVLKAGTDGGLYFNGARPSVPQYNYVVENGYDQTGVQYWFKPYGGEFPTGPQYDTHTPGYGIVWPIVFQKDCRLTGLSLYSYAAPSGTATAYFSLYGAHATTGSPAAKVADLFRFSGFGAGVTMSGTVTNASPVLTGRTLYFCVFWTTGANVQVWTRWPGGAAAGILRSSAIPSSQTIIFNGGPICYRDSTAGVWTGATGPATLNADQDAANLGSASFNAPVFWYGVTNA